jgi:riboflavin kinase/FMN adenylyltransferase
LEVIRLTQFNIKKPIVLTIGMFDGVHLGHQEILKSIQSYANQHDLETALLTFEPHPRLFLNPNDDFKLLTLVDEKIEYLSQTDLDYLLIQNFNEEFRNLTSEEFIEYLIQNINLHTLFVGFNHQFGKNRDGDFKKLQSLASKYHFKVIQIEEIIVEDTNKVSSTSIRNLIETGKIKVANHLLGRTYELSGKVIQGEQLGRKLGFPTANIDVDSLKCIPKNGVYAVRVIIGGKNYFGMMNIGVRPTINNNNKQIEVHIFDFSETIYSKNITVQFIDFIRDEQKFASLEDLITQIKKDEEEVNLIIKNFEF